jgi:hypothetical protein
VEGFLLDFILLFSFVDCVLEGFDSVDGWLLLNFKVL